tara:strand:- start:582 stop:728 length:147 start_codon:yes stop_codon:yes gene_type:complete
MSEKVEQCIKLFRSRYFHESFLKQNLPPVVPGLPNGLNESNLFGRQVH